MCAIQSSPGKRTCSRQRLPPATAQTKTKPFIDALGLNDG